MKSNLVAVAAVLGAASSSFAAPLEERATTYDYIVVGAGAGGLVTADRLSEAGHSVLLLERGPPSTYENGGRNGPDWAVENGLTRFDIPGLCNEIWVDSSGIACSDIDQMAGCLLGGGTSVNAGLWFKPPNQDWDVSFPEGWQGDDMTEAGNSLFNRIPGTEVPSQDGKLYAQESYNMLANIFAKNNWRNVMVNSEPNAKNQVFSHTSYMYMGGERGGPLHTYLQTAKARSNFKLALNSTVDKVIRDGAQITGVQVSAYGDNGLSGVYNVTEGTGRVILSAGTFGTAKILMRSAIGPPDQLAIVANSTTDGPTFLPEDDWILLPVGYNIMDHTDTDMVIQYPGMNTYDWYGAYTDPIPSDEEAYINSRSGIFTDAAPAVNTMAWQSFTGASDGVIRQTQWTIRVEGSLGFTGDNYVTLSQYLGTGMSSRGRIEIAPTLNMVTSIEPYVHTQDDIDAIIQGIAAMQEVLSVDPNVTFVSPTADQSADDFVNNYFASRRANHWLGSAKMGTDDGRENGGNSGSVVDLNTKVYGTNNLFVVDASVFPGITTCNPSAAIMMVAEQAFKKISALPTQTS